MHAPLGAQVPSPAGLSVTHPGRRPIRTRKGGAGVRTTGIPLAWVPRLHHLSTLI